MRFPALLALATLVLAAAPQAQEPDTIVHRFGDLRWQHGSFISSMRVLPGEKQALTAGYNGMIVLWDLEAGARLHTFQGGHNGEIFALALLADGKRFASGGMDGKVVVWDRETGAVVRTIEAFKAPGMQGMVRFLHATADGARLVASGGYQQPIKVLDPEAGTEIRSIPLRDPVLSALAVHPKTRHALVGSSKGAMLLDLETGEFTKEFSLPAEEVVEGRAPLPGHMQGIEGAGFDPQGRMAYGMMRGAGLVAWDIESGKVVKRLTSTSGYMNASSFFSKDGKQFASVGYDCFEIWEFETGLPLKKVRLSGGRHMELIRESKVAVVGTSEGALVLWDLAGEKRLSGDSAGPVNAIAVSPDGKRLLAGTRNGVNTLWDLKKGSAIRTFEKLSPKTYSDGSPTHDYASAFAFTADGRRAVSGHWDCRSALWEIETGKPIREWGGGVHATSVRSVAVSPDGGRVAAPSAICDIESGELIKKFDISPGAQTAVVFTPDGTHIITGANDQKLRFRDAVTGKVVREFEGSAGRVTSLAISPDGRFVVSGCEMGEPSRLWDVAEGKAIRTFAVKGSVLSMEVAVALSPDGKFLYTTGDGGRLWVWDVESGKTVKIFDGHLSTIKAIAVSPGGRFVATGSNDSIVIYRQPGLVYKARAVAWAEPLMKLDDDGKEFIDKCKRLFVGLKVEDYDVWTETMERAIALGERVVDRLIDAFPLPATGVPAERLAALLKELDQEDIETREKARKSLSELGESVYAWARDKMRDQTLSATVRAALDSFRREVESGPLKPLDATNLAEMRAVLILLELPASERREKGIRHFAKGAQNSVAARLARRHADQGTRR